MMLPPWNILHPLLRIVMEEDCPQLDLMKCCWSPFSRFLFSAYLLNLCLCDRLLKSSCMFGIDISSYMMHEYHRLELIVIYL
jgi:hypothetical protein